MNVPNHPNQDQILLENVLSALGSPLRLTVLKVLADGQEHPCGRILRGASKSTMTHHWRVLRDSGLIWQRPYGRENLLSLRREDMDVRFPGLLDSLLTAVKFDEQTVDVISKHQVTEDSTTE
ncbi:transcriptional regulator [Pseudomonas sp. DTU12.3]|uniref:ArsR/SmtB family transcription factor n=1 Tax=Pseudomonas sp. DTU12.3 TaxID=2073078 RepID=UPI001011E090|nr:helix-turn-helix domain-containing protein [Pseudomonas sp. DTU12.3]QAX83205.1 transcriptional regulator [Pseudomonas sp. DTU12.3]